MLLKSLIAECDEDSYEQCDLKMFFLYPSLYHSSWTIRPCSAYFCTLSPEHVSKFFFLAVRATAVQAPLPIHAGAESDVRIIRVWDFVKCRAGRASSPGCYTRSLLVAASTRLGSHSRSQPARAVKRWRRCSEAGAGMTESRCLVALTLAGVASMTRPADALYR